MSKKILEVCLSPDLGGLELFMVQCLEYFQKKSHAEVVVAHGTKLDDYIRGNKYYIDRNKFFPFISAKRLAKIIDDNDIDVVHFHWTKDMPIVVLAKVFSRKKPKIIQTRNMHMTRFKDDFYHKFFYKNIDCMHAVTNEVTNELTHFIPVEVRPEIEMIYMGVKEVVPDPKKVEILREKYNLGDSFVVGIVGRIQENKGQWMVIDALSKLKDKNIKALIIGHTMDDAYLQSLKDRVKEYGIEDKIIFTGFTKEVNEHFHLCDVAILATRNETFGLVVVEAMMNEVVVIATKKGGPIEIIEDKKDGLFFDRTVEDLYQKILYLFENREKVKEMAKLAKVKALQKFEYSKQLEKLYNLIEAM
ncbi:glycosyltransferase family 4 protein [Sulfurimonas sp.]|uniref:glycosyltransferase family 4 protein n=1 Tax=Sulfurimonas sp. TaxID=2022749 RepID=UPI00260DAAF2|nr:glycosyltransferase family 4 protein [Sulfurimonas sp.]